MINSLEDKTIISNDYIENEMTLLSNLIHSSLNVIDHSKIEKVLNSLKPEMFFNKQAKDIFCMFKELYQVSSVLLGTSKFIKQLQTMASFEHPELEYFIEGELQNYFASFTTIDYYVNKIHKLYFDERYKNASTRQEFEEIVQEEAEVSTEPSLIDLSDNATDILKTYESKKQTAIRTPYGNINKQIGSLQGGDMIVLAGTTGSGKTAFMLNFAKAVAKEKKEVLIFSLEMPKEQLQQRIICSEAGINASKFRDFSLSEEEKSRFKEYANKLKELPIRIYKNQTVTINQIKGIVRVAKPAIVFIDYMGLINSYENKKRYEKFSDISRDIKLLAMETNTPIVTLHQLNREIMSDARKNKKPKTSDLRDSGQIEQDADMIWFIHRPCAFDENADKSEMEFILAKDRHGEANITVPLRFEGKYQVITERYKYV